MLEFSKGIEIIKSNYSRKLLRDRGKIRCILFLNKRIELKYKWLGQLEIMAGYNISTWNELIVRKLVDYCNEENQETNIMVEKTELKNKIKR